MILTSVNVMTITPPNLFLSLTGGHQNGAAQFNRATAHQPQRDATYSLPVRQNPPPSNALAKLGSQKSRKGSRAAQNPSTNLDFLNVPDQGMSG